MILQALVKHYETLLRENKLAGQGWCQAKVSYALNLKADGELKGTISLKQEVERGKKKVIVPSVRTVPQMVSRSSGVSANFLCDNSKYMLGIDQDGTGKKMQERFEATKKKHLEILKSTDSEMAQAVKAFFIRWNPENAKNHPKLREVWEEITDGGNLIFVMDEKEAQEDEAIREAWQNSIQEKEDEEKGICLVTGKKDEIARIHTMIKGVQGAQSSGAALVSFNESAFGSYGKEQSYNAPVGKYAEFAYTTALNYLLAQKDYVFRFGDTTVIFWAESGEEIYQEVFGWFAEPQVDNQEIIRSIFEDIIKLKPIDIDGITLDKDQKFYILGLAPNAARLSVSFFYEGRFGTILENIRKHYSRMKMVKPSWEKRDYLGVGTMLYETVNQKSNDKKPAANLPGNLLKAILTDSRYPERLYGDIMIRIRAEQGRITWGRASVIKAYLIQNHQMEKEENFVGLNNDSNDTAYVLGRMFAVLEAVQEEANPGINATIKDRYFNAACAAPDSVFPILIKLENSHMRKLERQKEWRKFYYEKILTEIAGKLTEFPKSLTLEEQGRFILGYYHQVQKRYEKKEEA